MTPLTTQNLSQSSRDVTLQIDNLPFKEKLRLIKEAKKSAKEAKRKEREEILPAVIEKVGPSDVYQDIRAGQSQHSWDQLSFEEKLVRMDFTDPSLYIVLHNYSAPDSHESFFTAKQGAPFIVESKPTGSDYYYGYFQDTPHRKGRIPESLLVRPHGLGIYPWYHGMMSSEMASKRLAAGINGSFLVRKSLNSHLLARNETDQPPNTSSDSLANQPPIDFSRSATTIATTIATETATATATAKNQALQSGSLKPPKRSNATKMESERKVYTLSSGHKRISSSYILSVKDDGSITHFDIQLASETGHYYLNPSYAFESLVDLVDHYKKNRLRKSESGDSSSSRLEFTCPKVYIRPKDPASEDYLSFQQQASTESFFGPPKLKSTPKTAVAGSFNAGHESSARLFLNLVSLDSWNLFSKYRGADHESLDRFQVETQEDLVEYNHRCLAKTFELARPHLLLGRKLGSGQFGDVYRGVWRNSIPCAVKTMKDAKDEAHLKEFLYEANVMRLLKSRFCVRLLGICTLEKPYLILTEYMSRGSLKSFLKLPSFKQTASCEMIASLFLDIAAGMAYLEQMYLCHRDLAARNILVGKNLRLKIADFGMAKKYLEPKDLLAAKQDPAYPLNTPNYGYYIAPKDARFPIRWTAPESLLENKFNAKTDVWSFGVTFWEALTYGGQPYDDWPVKKVIHEVLQNHTKLPKPDGCPQWIYDILLDTWKREPEFRPTFEGIFSELKSRETPETLDNLGFMHYIFNSKGSDLEDGKDGYQTNKYYKSVRDVSSKYYGSSGSESSAPRLTLSQSQSYHSLGSYRP